MTRSRTMSSHRVRTDRAVPPDRPRERSIWCGEADRVRLTAGREPGELAGNRGGRPAESQDRTQR